MKRVLLFSFALAAVLFVATMLTPLEATPVGSAIEKLGAFTGPTSGTDQDDNVKASLDLAHTDLNTIIAYQEGTQTIAGRTYASVKQATAMDDDLFDVDGGAVLITSCVGVVTTNIVNATGSLKLFLDADTGFVNYDFSTAVDLDNDQAGQRIVFSSANASVLTPLASAGGSILMTPWFCGEGMIEQDNTDEDATGAIKWYITWIPYEDGTTVTAQ